MISKCHFYEMKVRKSSEFYLEIFITKLYVLVKVEVDFDPEFTLRNFAKSDNKVRCVMIGALSETRNIHAKTVHEYMFK